ncbi:hypothetical protein DSL72_002026 [Monilinia vaccinii-corymbosi]|uniref:Uncharacterized protein n=1 Tax=Monilinia vaccinii-corymbosi TaxID=61207 RepID=A0A8A3PBH0_9HELO|nr:hypothetical protein DSL72_002026 [Monilinia vaccinii-corymbosi]
MELMVDLLLRWLDPESALVLALTIPRFYQAYKGLFPQPINLNSLIRAVVQDPSYHIHYPGNKEILANIGALDPLRFNFWYPPSHYIYYGSLKITTQPETLDRYKNFGRFLAREVYAPNTADGSSSSRVNETANVALKKLKQRYLQWGMYNAMFLRLTGVPLEHPHNLGTAGWNVAVTEMLEGVVATMDKPASLLTVRRKSQLCFPWPARLNRMMADNMLMVFGEWAAMMGF